MDLLEEIKYSNEEYQNKDFNINNLLHFVSLGNVNIILLRKYIFEIDDNYKRINVFKFIISFFQNMDLNCWEK